MTLETKNGNALEPKKGLILHQTNCMGVMGAGIALQIAKKWPEAEKEYVKYCLQAAPRDLLGTVQFTPLTDDLWLGNLFCQVSPGPRATVYEAYPKVLREAVEEFDEDFPVHIPFGIGCGLAGGDWDVVLPMLEFYLAPFDEVNVWRFEPQLSAHLRSSPQPTQ